MNDAEYYQGLADGLKAWVEDKAADKVVEIKALDQQIEELNKLIVAIKAKRELLLDDLPRGMATALGYRSDGATIQPAIYFFAKRYNISLNEAKLKILATFQ